MKRFKHEWILDGFSEHPTFFTKSMFGGLAVYLFERQMLVLVEPTKSGRWDWHGVLVCTDHEHHNSLQNDFPALKPHGVLRKWLFIDSAHDNFEPTMEAVAERIARNDLRLGILPKTPKPKMAKPTKRAHDPKSRTQPDDVPAWLSSQRRRQTRSRH
jgi:hypothetical protein